MTNAPLFSEQLLTTLRSANHIAVLTGAGVSAESGIPTFREAQTGLWAQYDPQELATPTAFRKNPKLVWEWYTWRRQLVIESAPNPGHLALVEMEQQVPQFTLITQNVDGLHRFAGSQNVLELHGNIQKVRCADCGTFTEEWGDDSETVPTCEKCGGLLRPDVVWFGEALPRAELEAAVNASRACQVYFSIGTSGLVQPAASLAHAARNNGSVVVEINAEPTPLTPKVDFAFHGKSGEILPDLLKAVWGD